MTLDEAIKRLQELREQVGGDTEVRHSPSGWAHQFTGIHIAHVGKNDHSKLVSRGGIPVVLFTR